MKKLINENSSVVDDMFDGFMRVYARDYERIGEHRAFARKNRSRKNVALVIGGGSGHEPLFSGFCGSGMADAVVCGNIFASPDPISISDSVHAVDNGRGVLLVYGNYAGDCLNFDMAEELCAMEGLQTAHVRVWDDCASAPDERREDRRGIAGDVFVIKIAAAACAEGYSLDEVVRITERARDRVLSIGLATSPGSIPGLDKPTFTLPDGEIEYGMGLHGEPGVERTKMAPASRLVERMYGELCKEFMLHEGSRLAVLVNGLGSTTLLELYTVAGELDKLLEWDGLEVYDFLVGSYCTCQEMGGFSITLFELDEELRRLYDKPCHTPHFSMGLGR